ncbi:MAG TPA: rRNA adenine methyltransferase [Prolixibacteraceae bacterium]|jgi:ribulose-5-phosphate 4-epimerase/fuculose-1-phosphate aldolase|nr:rRNA adenine methyltransferase [Prolixibacteraceae bacterium]
MNEGSIKFNCLWEQKEVGFPNEIYVQLETARRELYNRGLIGMYPNGIGYGNISVRKDNTQTFIISGSATGGFSYLKQSDYAKVTNYNISENTIYCTGLIKASAESLTHAAVYQSLPEVGAVVHVHCLWLWEKLMKDYPTTSPEIEYGTPAMAEAVGKLALDIDGREEKIIAMGGHHEGIVVFGSSLMEATEQIINIYNRFKND